MKNMPDVIEAATIWAAEGEICRVILLLCPIIALLQDSAYSV